MTTNSKWLNTKQVCEQLDIDVRTLYRLIDEGKIPAYKMGRVIRLKAADVNTFVESARVKPTQELGAADEGYAVIEIGSVPPWMKLVTSMDVTHDDGSGWNENVYRLPGEGDS